MSDWFNLKSPGRKTCMMISCCFCSFTYYTTVVVLLLVIIFHHYIIIKQSYILLIISLLICTNDVRNIYLINQHELHLNPDIMEILLTKVTWPLCLLVMSSFSVFKFLSLLYVLVSFFMLFLFLCRKERVSHGGCRGEHLCEPCL